MERFSGTLVVIKDFVFLFGSVERREVKPSRDNNPCNSLADVVNLLCARSHSNARKLDALLVDQCSSRCLVARREEKKEEKRGSEETETSHV